MNTTETAIITACLAAWAFQGGHLMAADSETETETKNTGKLHSVQASHTYRGDSLDALWSHDLPKSSRDQTIPRWTSYPQKGKPQWVELDLGGERQVAKFGVYWYDDAAGVQVPASWHLEARNGSAKPWRKVEVTKIGSYSALKDQFNTVQPDGGVKARHLRIVMMPRKDATVGILSVECALQGGQVMAGLELCESWAAGEREAGAFRTFRGKHLAAIDFPVGGIGSGSIRSDGQAARRRWHIFNNIPAADVPNSLFAVRAQAADAPPVSRVLQTVPFGPFLPMQELTLHADYPLARYEFHEPALPVAVSLEAFNPLIPLDVENSSIPCAIYNLTARNTGDRPAQVSFLATQHNAVGFDGRGRIEGRSFSGYGGNMNRVSRGEHATFLHLSADQPKDAPGYGDMVLAILTPDKVSAAASWDGIEALAKEFTEAGRVTGPESAGPSPAGQSLDGALAVPFTLAPGESRTVPFLLTWHFPNARHGDEHPDQGYYVRLKKGDRLTDYSVKRGWGGRGNMYANWWTDALDVARYVEKQLDELTQKTQLYHDALYASNLPRFLLDRISSQMTALRSPTCFWTKDGYFGGWEGITAQQGSCYGNNNHVWHYAQGHARLFPRIGRIMLEQQLDHQFSDGGLPHRQSKQFRKEPKPKRSDGTPTFYEPYAPATDGHCGAILEAYRGALTDTNHDWLRKHWPRIKKAMEYAVAEWDKDENGVLAGVQPNTLDAPIDGSSSWHGSLYLAALAAAEKMAVITGDANAARSYARIRVAGSKRQDETLFNGEHYIHIPEGNPNPPEAVHVRAYGNGCEIDQVLGQWWAHQLDLGWVYPVEHVRSALRSVYRYNRIKRWRRTIYPDDTGLVICTYPHGKPSHKYPQMGFTGNVMEGFEYAAAASMMQAGLVDEGLAVIKAVHARHDGRFRNPGRAMRYGGAPSGGNPFGDDECGLFYSRSMAIWSMLLASQGFVYDGPAGRIGFRPVWQPEDHASFFTTAEGWGLFSQTREDDRQTDRIEVKYGILNVQSLVFELPEGAKPTEVRVMVGEIPCKTTHAFKDGCLTVTLSAPVALQQGDVIEATPGIAKE